MSEPFDEQRRRLQEAMEAEIGKIRAAYRARLEAVDRAEELMRFASEGSSPDAPEISAGETASAGRTSRLRRDLARLVAGWTGELRLEDAEARVPGVSRQAIRACLDRMARDGEVRVVQAGGRDTEPVYEVPEPRYGDVTPEG